MTKFKISHINTSSSGGGAATVARLLANAQLELGHDAKIIAKTIEENDKLGISFATEAPQLLKDFCEKEGLLDYAYQGSHRLIYNQQIQQSDILNLHNLHGEYFNPFSLYLLSNKKPTVWTLHDMQAITGHCAHSMNCKRYVTGCSSCKDLKTYPGLNKDSTSTLLEHKKDIYKNSILDIIVPSNWLARRTNASILNEHPIHVIHNGINTNIFKKYNKSDCRKELGLPEDALLIGSTSHFGVLSNPWKGGENIINTMNNVWSESPNTFFVNIGDNTKSKNPKIFNIPHINDRETLAKAFSALDIFLYASNADNCPLVIMEAMSCELPIVSTRTGGIPELIEDEISGLLAPYKDSDTLTKKTIELINNKDKRALLGKNARISAEKNFNIKLTNEKYLAIYEKAIENFNQRLKNKKNSIQIPDIINTNAFKSAVSKEVRETREREKNIAFDYFSNSNLSECEKKTTELVKEDPSDFETITLLGLVYVQKGDNDLARELFINALKLNQYNTQAYNELNKIRIANYE